MKTDKINAILFDVGGTLHRSTPSCEQKKREKFHQIMDLIGAESSLDEFSKLINARARAYRRWTEEIYVELNEQELWTQWLLPEWPEEEIEGKAVMLNSLLRAANTTRTIYPETASVLLELYRRGYHLGVVSNTTSSVDAPNLLNELKLSGCFDTVVLSAQAGKRKPDPTMLLQAASEIGVDPAQCAYVGNATEKDAVAANRAGYGMAVILKTDHSLDDEIERRVLTEPDHWISSLNDLLDLFPRREPVPPEVVYNASLSTMWAPANFPTLSDFDEFARRAGFAGIELNHKVDSRMLTGNHFRQYAVRSVHEPCPSDVPVEALKRRDWLVSSLDEDNRRAGVEAIKRSIDLAERFQAKKIIVHVGHVQFDHSLELRLRALYSAGSQHTAEYLDIKRRMMRQRASLAPAGLNSVKKSLKELLDYAGRFGICLGLENRYHYMEYPSPDELETLLAMAGPEQLGFIFDIGHAQHLSRLGFYAFDEWLKRFSLRIIGAHLHDISGLEDHHVPGAGDLEFDQIAPYLPQDAFRTCEFGEFNSPQQVKAGLKFLFDSGCVSKL